MQTRHIQLLVIFSLFLMGFTFGYFLCQKPGVTATNLSNLAGISADFIGVLLLSHLVATSEKFKRFVLIWLSFSTAWLLIVFPLGLLASCFIGLFSMWPSTNAVGTFGVGFLFMVTPAMSVMSDIAMIPYDKKLVTTDNQVTKLGGLYVIVGLLTQLLVAWHQVTG